MDNVEFEAPDLSGVVLPSFDLGEKGRLERAHVQHLEAVFDLIVDHYFYIKGQTGRWIACNTASLRLLSLTRHEDVIGRREDSFFPRQIATAIRADDRRVLQKGVRISNRVELIPNERGQLVWVVSNKFPIRTRDMRIVGLIGLTRILPESLPLPISYEVFRKVISHIDENIHDRLAIPDLAAIFGSSDSHFRRRFKALFGVSAQEFILRTRLQAASRQLLSTGKPIAQIALDCGLSDQSYFTRQFRRFFGLSPGKYRSRWRSG